MTISEVSKKYDISTDTLRYYERIGLLPTVPRTKSGLRDYDENSCKSVEFIKCMRNAGLPIEALIEYMTLFKAVFICIFKSSYHQALPVSPFPIR